MIANSKCDILLNRTLFVQMGQLGEKIGYWRPFLSILALCHISYIAILTEELKRFPEDSMQEQLFFLLVCARKTILTLSKTRWWLYFKITLDSAKPSTEFSKILVNHCDVQPSEGFWRLWRIKNELASKWWSLSRRNDKFYLFLSAFRFGHPQRLRTFSVVRMNISISTSSGQLNNSFRK